MLTTTYVYADPDHPDRPTSAIASPAYTSEDRALLLGLAEYENTLCRCGQPKAEAWHSEMDGWYDGHGVVCHACTAANDGKQVVYAYTTDTRTPTVKAQGLPHFLLGVTTTKPDPPSTN